MDWIENGPVSAPPRQVAVGAAAVIFVAAALGLGLGFHAVMRDDGRRSIGDIDQIDTSQAVAARPIVEIPTAPPPPPAAANAVDANSTDEAKDDSQDQQDIAAKTAAAQSIQAQPAKPQADIDQILASPTEKPQAPQKPTQDEDAAPKSDVPF